MDRGRIPDSKASKKLAGFFVRITVKLVNQSGVIRNKPLGVNKKEFLMEAAVVKNWTDSLL
jgi:hypothetical protein